MTESGSSNHVGGPSFHLILLLLGFCLISLPALAAVDHEIKKVLVIHSYHKGLSWTDSLVRGIDEKLSESQLSIELSHDFMDTKRIFSEAYLSQIANFYAEKYKDNDLDLIISTDDHAFQFLLKHQPWLFPDIPVVFSGVNNYKPEMLEQTKWFTGVTERFDIPATLQLVTKLHPKVSRFVAISDQSLTGKTNRNLFRKAVDDLGLDVDVLFLDNHSMEEVREEVSKLSATDISFWLTFTSDRLGRYYSFRQSAAEISEVNTVPLYSFWDFHLGYGTIGGRLASGFYQGYKAGELAAAILGGTEVSDVPVILESPNRYMFDYIQLQRYGIDSSLLPKDSVIINQPEGFYAKYRTIVWTICLGFVALGSIIFLLLVNLIHRRRANLMVQKAKNRFQHIFNVAAVPLIELDFNEACLAFEEMCRDCETQKFEDVVAAYKKEGKALLPLVKIVDCNHAAVSLYRAGSKKELLRTGVIGLRLISADTFIKLLHTLIRGSERVEWEGRGLTLDGEKLHLLKHMQQFETSPHLELFSSVIISVVDITEREKYLSELRMSEDRFRTLFDNAASGIALCDASGNYLRVNEAFSSMVGYGKEELQTKNWRDITHSDGVEDTEEIIADVLAGKEMHPVEKKYIHKEGKFVWALLTVGLYSSEAGKPQLYVAQAQDITQIKEVQARMRLREERYKQIFEADLSGFYIADPSGKLLLCNEVFAGIIGFETVGELVGQNVAPYYRKADTWTNLVNAIGKTKQLENMEVELLRSDGVSINVISNAIGRYDEDGYLVEIQGHIMDISNQKKLEGQLVRAQKMEAIGLMAGGVAHDLNNILSGIISYPDLMLRNLDEDSSLIKPLTSMRESGKRAAAVVADLLTVARGAANVRELHNLKTLAIEYLESPECLNLRGLYPQITIRLESETDSGTILCSPVHIKKCIMNLVTNAVEAVEQSGEVTIKVTEDSLREDVDGEEVFCDYIKLAVYDNGTGISEQDKDHIFEPFYTKKVMGRSGTGLGLAVVWNAVQDHGGRIQVDSSPAGTTFTLFFPRYEKIEIESATDKDPVSIEGRGEHILVVDDEPMLRDIAKQILLKLGYKVDTVQSGEAALRFLQHSSVDLVLLDMFMDPGINGCQTYERLIRIREGQKAVIASGYSKSDDVKKALQLGVGSFIEKPYSLEQLGRAVAKELKT